MVNARTMLKNSNAKNKDDLIRQINEVIVVINEIKDAIPIDEMKIAKDTSFFDLRCGEAVSSRLANTCLRNGYETIGDICSKTKTETRNMPKLGRKSFQELECLLERAGLKFRDE